MTSEIIEMGDGRQVRFHNPGPQRTPSQRRRDEARNAYRRALTQAAAMVSAGLVDEVAGRADELQRLHDAWVATEAQALGEVAGLVKARGEEPGDGAA